MRPSRLDRGLPLCPVCDKPLISWAAHADPYDWYCSTRHGNLGEGLFFRDEWDGEAFVQVVVKVSEAEIKSMREHRLSPAVTSQTLADRPWSDSPDER